MFKELMEDLALYDIVVLPKWLSWGFSLFVSPSLLCYGPWGHIIMIGHPECPVTAWRLRRLLVGRKDGLSDEANFCFALLHEIGHLEAEGGLRSAYTADKASRQMHKAWRKEMRKMNRREKNQFIASLPGEKEADDYASWRLSQLMKIGN